MFDNVLHIMESLHYITESFHAFLLRLHGPSHDDFLKLGGLFAWAETLTVIAAAYMRHRQVVRRVDCWFENRRRNGLVEARGHAATA